MDVVVTGASGHVGANLVRALVARGDRVRVLCRQSTAGFDGLPVEVVRGDVRDLESLRAAFAGAARVYHLAARISLVGDPDGEVEAINVGGAANAARAALEVGVGRLVHVSSIHAFVQRPRDQPLDETRAQVAGPRHPAYDRTKAAGEREVRAQVDRGLDAVIVNPTAVIGPHDLSGSPMGEVFVRLLRRRMPALVSGGFDWVDSRDVAAGIIAAAERGRTGEGYILSGHWASVRDLARLACEITGVRAPRLTVPRWLAHVGVPFVGLASRARGHAPIYTRESLRALAGNRQIRSAKAAVELGYTARPLRETVEAVYADLAERERTPAQLAPVEPS